MIEQKNGVKIDKINNKEIEDLEPNVNCQFDHGLYVPFNLLLILKRFQILY